MQLLVFSSTSEFLKLVLGLLYSSLLNGLSFELILSLEGFDFKLTSFCSNISFLVILIRSSSDTLPGLQLSIKIICFIILIYIDLYVFYIQSLKISLS